MERCIYDLIIGNDIYKRGGERYDVEQRQIDGEEKMIDMIFENSKLGRGAPQHKKEGGNTDIQTVQVEDSNVEQSAGRVDRKSKVEVEENHSAAVQTRAQKQVEARAPRPLKVKEVEALNVSCDEFKLMQKEDENLTK